MAGVRWKLSVSCEDEVFVIFIIVYNRGAGLEVSGGCIVYLIF